MSKHRAKREKKGKAKPKSTKKSRSEIKRRNVQQGKPMNEGVQQVQQVKAKVPVSRVKELGAGEGSMSKKDEKLLESSGIMQVGAYLQEDTSPGPAPSESSELGEQKQSPVVFVDTKKTGLPAHRPKYTPAQITHKKTLFLKAMNRGIFSPGIAARAADISRNTALAWRDTDPEFAARWDELTETALDRIEETIRKTCLNLTQPHKLTGLLALLNAYRRERFMPMTRHEHVGVGGGPILMAVAAKIKNMNTEELRVELSKILGPAICKQPDKEGK